MRQLEHINKSNSENYSSASLVVILNIVIFDCLAVNDCVFLCVWFHLQTWNCFFFYFCIQRNMLFFREKQSRTAGKLYKSGTTGKCSSLSQVCTGNTVSAGDIIMSNMRYQTCYLGSGVLEGYTTFFFFIKFVSKI